MNPHFRQVAKIYFPQATVVVDKYHVIRQAYWAMERVRKNKQKNYTNGIESISKSPDICL